MKDIFSYNADVNKTAYMNWRTSHHDHKRVSRGTAVKNTLKNL